jgi:hypothetical protein
MMSLKAALATGAIVATTMGGAYAVHAPADGPVVNKNGHTVNPHAAHGQAVAAAARAKHSQSPTEDPTATETPTAEPTETPETEAPETETPETETPETEAPETEAPATPQGNRFGQLKEHTNQGHHYGEAKPKSDNAKGLGNKKSPKNTTSVR